MARGAHLKKADPLWRRWVTPEELAEYESYERQREDLRQQQLGLTRAMGQILSSATRRRMKASK